MKKILLVLAGTVAAWLLATPTATASEPACDTHTTAVTGRPDSGAHGNWATDTFTRTTKVCKADATTYVLTLTDKGTFTTLAGALSPGAGVALPEPFTGDFNGGVTVTVTSDVAPVAPPAASPGDKSSSEWAGLLFPGNNGTISEWGWTYTYCDEKWVNAESGNSGDVTGAETCDEEEPTTTTPPPTTTPAPAGRADVDNGETTSDDEPLARTGTGGSALPWLISGGLVLLLGGGTLLVLARRRAAGK